jgi:(R)-2-hydroxyacyl-CoA dehydratese activating ATPase
VTARGAGAHPRGGVFAGIDAGSWNTKAVVIDADCRWLGSAVVRTGADLPGAAGDAFEQALAAAGIEAGWVEAIWATGFGRRGIPFAHGTRTELDCHARGVRHHLAGALTIIDIGGQDAKVIILDSDGRRISHRMNRKCAAGTGSFLDEMALRLNLHTEQLGALAAGFQEEIELGSFCTVFSGTELLAAIRQGRRPADLARAAYKSVVKRVLEMDVFEGRIAATGGVVAYHPMVVQLFEQFLHTAVIVPPHPQEQGAFGAALVAREAVLNGVPEQAENVGDLP